MINKLKFSPLQKVTENNDFSIYEYTIDLVSIVMTSCFGTVMIKIGPEKDETNVVYENFQVSPFNSFFERSYTRILECHDGYKIVRISKKSEIEPIITKLTGYATSLVRDYPLAIDFSFTITCEKITHLDLSAWLVYVDVSVHGSECIDKDRLSFYFDSLLNDEGGVLITSNEERCFKFSQRPMINVREFFKLKRSQYYSLGVEGNAPYNFHYCSDVQHHKKFVFLLTSLKPKYELMKFKRKIELVSGVIEWLHNNLNGDINVNILSKKSGYSKRHFQKLFKNITGLSVGRYVERLKLDIASQELLLTNKRIIEISTHSGFNSQQSFARAFKRNNNLTPSEYRGHRSLP